MTTSAAARPGTPARAQATTFTVATTIDAPHAAPVDGTCTSTLSGGACTLVPRSGRPTAPAAGRTPGPTILRNTIVDSPLPAACAVPIGSGGSNLEFPGNTCGFTPQLGRGDRSQSASRARPKGRRCDIGAYEQKQPRKK